MDVLLEKIKAVSCPHCREKQVTEASKKNQHCSGEWNEYLLFRCGFSYSYSPNFPVRGVFASSVCKNDKSYHRQLEKREAAKQAVRDFIKTLDVDKVFKTTLGNTLVFISEHNGL